MDSDNDAVAEKDPTGRYIRYNEMIRSDDALLNQFKAFDQNHGVEVAWNQVSTDDGSLSPDQIQLLGEEINLLKSLKHKNVVRFHESWIDQKNKRINIITESFASGSLREYRTKHKKIDMKVIKNWARQILRGLHYLHTHNPPVVIQDLALDKVFVNGNNGEVKIGTNCRFLAILHNKQQLQVAVQNNQLSFGMCMLEMVTGDNPYSHSLLMHKALSRMFDPQAKHFIENCLSMTLSAVQLLEDPFLATHQGFKEVQLSDGMSKQVSLKLHSESRSPEVTDVKKKKKTSKKKSLQLAASSKTNTYGLRGMETDEKTISFTLDVANKQSGASKKIEFSFYLQSDTSVLVAEEMIQQLEFSREDVAVVVGLIDALLSEFDGCSNNNNNNAIHKPVRQQNNNLPSAKHKQKESSSSNLTATLPLSNTDDQLKLQLDAIDMHCSKSFREILKNISII